jgi:hypothetical protein
MITVASRRNTVFEGIQRGWERTNEGSKKACLNTVRKELRKKIETCYMVGLC